MLRYDALGVRPKVILLCCFLVSAAILSPLTSDSAVVGDVDGDGKIELSEAIYALQVASGHYPSVNSSCQLEGKGNWSLIPTDYVQCDVVKESGSYYICTTNHTSSATFTTDSANWTLLALSANWDKNNSDIYYNNGKVGIGTSNPAASLHVNGSLKVDGLSSFSVGSGTIDFSTPGGWPGIIFKSPNGHRREIAVHDSGMYMAVSNSANAPPVTNGIWINEEADVGLGTTAPEAKLDVRGQVKVSGGIRFADQTTQTTAFPGVGPGSGLDADTIDGLQASELISYAGSSIPPGSKFPVAYLEIEGIALPDPYQYTLDGRTFQTNIEVIEYQDGEDLVIRKRPGRTRYGNVTLSHVIPAGSTSGINSWHDRVKDGTYSRRDIILTIHEANPATSLIIYYYEAWPSAISHRPLSPNQWEETFVLTFEIMEIASTDTLNITSINYAEIETFPELIVFQEFSGGNTSTEIIEYQVGEDLVLRKRPGITKVANLNFIGTGARSGMLMWNWYKAVRGGTFSRNTVRLEDTGQSGSKVYYECWPSGFAGLSANAEADITFDQITVTCEISEMGL